MWTKIVFALERTIDKKCLIYQPKPVGGKSSLLIMKIVFRDACKIVFANEGFLTFIGTRFQIADQAGKVQSVFGSNI